MKKIFFSSADRKINVLYRKRTKKLILKIFISEKVKLKECRFIFCSDNYLLKMNKSYLQHNYFTDIITFTLSEIKKPIIGEIYLSVDRIKENAKIFLIPYQDELLRVFIHGCLHLCGYNDNTKEMKILMTLMEDYYLNQF